MNICGIVSEFNPFHGGHAYLIEEARRILGSDTGIVCVMSGDFVQRGEVAAYCKHDRARAAVAGGADLILELPLPWCLASAEGFARGAVGMLNGCGIVTHLCFGSECGDLSALRETASLLLRPEMNALIRNAMGSGASYPSARQKAAEALAGKPMPVLASPNDILAVEYLKALERFGAEITPLVVKRVGSGHDSAAPGDFPSASYLRQRLEAGESVSCFLPPEVSAALEAGEGAIDRSRLEIALLSRLRMCSSSDFAAVPDVSEGLEHRLAAAAVREASLQAVCDAAAAKRYTASRIRRILCCAALGVRRGDAEGIPPYLRVLSANQRGREILRELTRTAALPVITKPSAVRLQEGRAERVFALTAAAEDLYALGMQSEASRLGDRDWRTAPYIVSSQI